MSRITMKELAELAGVSSATVSRTFQAPNKVRKERREKILNLAEQYGYVYNANAADLSRNISDIIGVLVPTSNKSVFGETLTAIQEQAQNSNYSTIIGSTYYDKTREKQIIRQLQERRVAGIIFTGFTIGQERMISELIDKGIACVVIWEKIEIPNISYVGFDNFKAAYSAVDYLISLRHKRIGLLIGPYEKLGRTQKRFFGYKKALEDHGIEYDSSLVVSSEPDLLEGKQGMSHLLSLENPPTAVFAATDRLAIGGYAAIKEKKLRIPEDISVVGFDDVEFAAFCDPPLTTVRVPAKEMGTIAVKLISSLIETQNTRVKQYCLDSELIIRDSCSEPK